MFNTDSPQWLESLLVNPQLNAVALVQLYETFSDFEQTLAWNNPFREHLQAVARKLETEHPEIWGKMQQHISPRG